MTTTEPALGDETPATFEIEINAGVDAADDQHALIFVALKLLECAYAGEDGRVREFGPRAPAGYVGWVDFKLEQVS